MSVNFEPGPERITLYFCKECQGENIAGDYAPAYCEFCEHTEFWSEFDKEAPSLKGEEENCCGQCGCGWEDLLFDN